MNFSDYHREVFILGEESHAGLKLRRFVCFNFYRGWREVAEYYRKSLPDGVSLQQTYILEMCEEGEGMLVNQLAHALEIDTPAVSGMLRRMEKTGIIRREVQLDNRRQTRVFLTTEGEQLREKVRGALAGAEAALKKVVQPEDLDTLVSLADRIRSLNA